MYDVRATSTYRALMCQEIAENICEFLDPSYHHQGKSHHSDGVKSIECKRTLARLARTCKALSDPALRVLWRRLSGLKKLLQLLPQYAEPKQSSYFTHDPKIPKLLSAEPDDHEWARLQSYAVRVRELNYWEWNRVDSKTWTILSRRCNGESLFPRLERLVNFDVRNPECDAPLISHLLFPLSLRYLTLSCDPWLERERGVQNRDMLEDIVARVPNLQHLSLSRDMDKCPSLHPIKELQELKSLSFPPNIAVDDDDLLTHCASLPSLRDFSFRIDTQHGTKLPSIKHGFHLLTRISLQGSAADIVWFFKETSVTSLRDVSLTFDRATNTYTLLRSLQAILPIVSPSLRYFSLDTTVDVSEPLSLLKAVEPLLDLRSLQKFSATSTQALSLSADDLVRMATAWPDIRVLHISDHRLKSSTSVLPARIMEHVALRCPRLESLKLPKVDFADLPPQAHEPVLDHGLVDLDFYPGASVEDSDDEQPEEDSRSADASAAWLNAAVFIDRLFPGLELEEDGAASMMCVRKKGGKKLVAYLSALRTGRRHAEAFDRLRVDGIVEPLCESRAGTYPLLKGCGDLM
ncbi:hypothetical protein C8T65DRAFT_829666 [Cerioporus squamosus]|nr:hypothetical protein C8T65DRAFT_829666 [Cerioporus squamosus]